MSASWLKNFLAPIRVLVGSVLQTRDDRIDFRLGFVASQVPDADGVNVLTIDSEVGAAVVNPDPDSVVKRNGSGAMKATTVQATTFAFTAPVSIQRDEPVIPLLEWDPIGGWSTSGTNPVSNVVGLEYATEIKSPAGAILTSFSVLYKPNTGHVGLPASQPKVSLVGIDEDGVATPIVAPVQDNAASVVLYEVTRTLTSTIGVPFAIDPDMRYVVVFEDESGANSIAGTTITRVARWTATVTGVSA